MADSVDCDKKPKCKFGANCYRKNADHVKNYYHPKRKNEEKDNDQPKKKTKIEHFFKGIGDTDCKKKEKSDVDDESNDEVVVEKEDESRPTAEDSNSSDVRPETGNTSGYVREEEEEVDSAGQSGQSGAEDDEEKTEKTEADAPASPEDVKENIKQKYLMEMPDDFYEFWEFCKSLNDKKPSDALKKTLGLQLVGPFDILAGNYKKKNRKGKTPCYQRHWRYYYDPPEFTTIIRGDDTTQFHFGYFRDDPSEMPVFIASNAAKENCTITPRGENIFAAINWFLDEELKKTKYKELSKLQTALKDFAKSKDFSLELKTKKMAKRQKNVVCKTFHGAGLVVPVDEKTEIGYRPVPESVADLKKMFKRIEKSETDEERDKNIDPLQELITLIQFANDECDYGEGIELGLDLFSYGGDTFHPFIMTLLPLGYKLLRRHAYAQIIQAHLANRRRTSDLSEFCEF